MKSTFKCWLCNGTGKSTKDHIIPNFILRRHNLHDSVTTNNVQYSKFKIKLCSPCNTYFSKYENILSDLDNLGKKENDELIKKSGMVLLLKIIASSNQFHNDKNFSKKRLELIKEYILKPKDYFDIVYRKTNYDGFT